MSEIFLFRKMQRYEKSFFYNRQKKQKIIVMNVSNTEDYHCVCQKKQLTVTKKIRNSWNNTTAMSISFSLCVCLDNSLLLLSHFLCVCWFSFFLWFLHTLKIISRFFFFFVSFLMCFILDLKIEKKRRKKNKNYFFEINEQIPVFHSRDGVSGMISSC